MATAVMVMGLLLFSVQTYRLAALDTLRTRTEEACARIGGDLRHFGTAPNENEAREKWPLCFAPVPDDDEHGSGYGVPKGHGLPKGQT